MTARDLIEGKPRGSQDLMAEIEQLEREWDDADGKPHLEWKKAKIMKKIAEKRRWLAMYQAVDSSS